MTFLESHDVCMFINKVLSVWTWDSSNNLECSVRNGHTPNHLINTVRCQFSCPLRPGVPHRQYCSMRGKAGHYILLTHSQGLDSQPGTFLVAYIMEKQCVYLLAEKVISSH
jgi:hypothetical protein